jgi:hypothetical protein
MNDESAIRTRFEKLAPFLNERTRRLFTAAEAAAIGRGGITAVTRATGVSRRAVAAGLVELHPPQKGQCTASVALEAVASVVYKLPPRSKPLLNA